MTRILKQSSATPHWTKLLDAHQYALFVFDTRTRTPRNADGSAPGSEGRSLAILGSREEALAFANDVVSRDRSVFCEIYDKTAEYGEPIETIRDATFRDKYFRDRARKEVIGGAVLFLCGVVLAGIDFHRDLQWIWGYVIGLKCIIVGTGLMAAGWIGLCDERARRT